MIGDSEVLVVKQEANIAKIEDLAGKRVAAPFGSTTDYHLMRALKLAGVPPEELTLTNLEPRQMAAAWKRGDIDGAFVWQPTLSVLPEHDAKGILSSRQLAEKGGEIKWFGAKAPIGFTSSWESWHYVEEIQLLPDTRKVIDIICNFRIQLTF